MIHFTFIFLHLCGVIETMVVNTYYHGHSFKVKEIIKTPKAVNIFF